MPLSNADKRSLAQIERMAREVLAQCEHLRRNMEHADSDDRFCDRSRFDLIAAKGYRLLKAAELATRRFHKEHGEGAPVTYMPKPTRWPPSITEDQRPLATSVLGAKTAPRYAGQYRDGPGRMNAWLPGGAKYSGAMESGS